MADLQSMTIDDTGYLGLPSGTTAQRPASPAVGYTRWNTSLSSIEVYDGTSWVFQYNPNENGLNYSWYSHTQSVHPSDASTFDTFISNSTLQGTGVHTQEINWGSINQENSNNKPNYLPADNYVWVAEGYIYAPESGTYTFGTNSDDASDVFVDNTLTAYWYGGHGTSSGFTGGTGQSTGQVNLDAGKYYPFTARMEEVSSADALIVGWQKPGDTSIQVIPALYFKRYG